MKYSRWRVSILKVFLDDRWSVSVWECIRDLTHQTPSTPTWVLCNWRSIRGLKALPTTGHNVSNKRMCADISLIFDEGFSTNPPLHPLSNLFQTRNTYGVCTRFLLSEPRLFTRENVADFLEGTRGTLLREIKRN